MPVRATILLLLAVFSSSGRSWSAQGATYVSREQVTTALENALSRAGLDKLDLDSSQVSMAKIPVRNVRAVIKVESIEIEPRTKVISARLRCAEGECLPFFVIITQLNTSDFAGFGFESHSGIRLGQRLQVVRSGDKAQLRMVLPGVRLSVPVVCLQGGAVGDSIRVRRVNSGRVLVGRVESAGVLSPVGRYR